MSVDRTPYQDVMSLIWQPTFPRSLFIFIIFVNETLPI